MPDITSVPWTDFSTGGLLALAIVLIIRGDLIPRRTHDAVIADRDFWRQQAQAQQQINAEMIEAAQTTARVLDALPRSADHEEA